MILFLSSSVPPRLSGQSAVVQNLATQFRHDEMVIVGKRVPHGPAFEWPTDGPEIIYATGRWATDRRGARWWGRLQFPLLLAKTIAVAIRYRCKVLIVVSPPPEFVLAGYLAAKLTGMRLRPQSPAGPSKTPGTGVPQWAQLPV